MRNRLETNTRSGQSSKMPLEGEQRLHKYIRYKGGEVTSEAKEESVCIEELTAD